MFFSSPIATKWFVAHDFDGLTYFLVSAENNARHLVWTQQIAKAIKFDTTEDAETVMAVIKSHRKNKKLIYRVK